MSRGFSALRNHFLRTPVFRRRSSTARSWRSLPESGELPLPLCLEHVSLRSEAAYLLPNAAVESESIGCDDFMSIKYRSLLKIVWLSILPLVGILNPLAKLSSFHFLFGTLHKIKAEKNFHIPDRLKIHHENRYLVFVGKLS